MQLSVIVFVPTLRGRGRGTRTRGPREVQATQKSPTLATGVQHTDIDEEQGDQVKQQEDEAEVMIIVIGVKVVELVWVFYPNPPGPGARARKDNSGLQGQSGP